LTLRRAFIVPSILLLVLGIVVVARPVFLSPQNLSNIALQASILALVAAGMTPLIVSGQIDLSVGSVMALSGVLAALGVAAGIPAPLAAFVAVVSGVIVGAGNGLIVSFLKVPSFIATLAAMGIARGAALILSEGRPIASVGATAESLGSGTAMGVPAPILLAVAVCAVAHLLLQWTKIGLHVRALGGSPRAAWVAGLPIARLQVITFAASGAAAALGGIVLSGRLGSAQPIVGAGYELDAITAVVVGGGSLAGGRGTVLGTAAAVLLLSAVRVAMVLFDIAPYYHQVVTGCILILAVILNSEKHSEAWR
jgi:ribose transport system permease protein